VSLRLISYEALRHTISALLFFDSRKSAVKYYPKKCPPVIVRKEDKFLFVVLTDKQKSMVSAPSPVNSYLR